MTTTMALLAAGVPLTLLLDLALGCDSRAVLEEEAQERTAASSASCS